MKAILLVAVLMVAGCGTLAPPVADRGVAIACVDDLPPKPALVTDPDLRAMTDYQIVLALWRDRLQRAGYELQLEAALLACRG